jgi:hypothetical protein
MGIIKLLTIVGFIDEILVLLKPILVRVRTIRKGLHNTNRSTLTQVTYDHSLSCFDKLNTSIFKTRQVNKPTIQKRLHSPNRVTFI